MLVSLIIATQVIYTIAEIYNGPEFNQSEPNSSQHIWHSYVFNTGAGNREGLYFSNVGLNRYFEPIDDVFAWKSLAMQKEVVIVGLRHDLVVVTKLYGDNNSTTYNEEFHGSAKALAVFQKWDPSTQGIRSFIVVAIHNNAENYILKWYQILDRKLKLLWDWPFYGNVTHLDVIKINHELKLLIVYNKGSFQKTFSADIYSFNINYNLDIWLFEKINLDAIPSSVAIFDNNDDIFFCASFPSLEAVHIFKYSKFLCMDTLEKKHFVSYQKIFSIGLKSVISFRVGFRWYLAIAGRTSLIYYIGENLFQPVRALKLGSFNNWLAIPIDTYREDTILLADSNSDVYVITWTEDEQLEVLGSFTEIACEYDVHCLDRMKAVELNASTVFVHNGHQNIILSFKNGGSPLLFKMLIKLKPLPDQSTLKLMDMLHLKNSLEQNFSNQNEQIIELMFHYNSTNLTEEIVLKEPISFSTETIKTKLLPEITSHTKNHSWIISDVNQLKATVELLNRDIKEFLTELKSNVSQQIELDPEAIFTKNVTDGVTFYGNVLVGELYLSAVNGYNVNELLEDSFRKNKANKIGGKKTLKYLNSDNVIFEKIGDNLACEIVFSDDLWEEQKNIINGNIVWERELTILNDLVVLDELSKKNISNKSPPGMPKHAYDALNMQELEVTEDTYIQRTINGQPLILPVHSAQLNILDIVNQARIEVVNVKQNLDVDFINKKNFTSLFEQLQFKPPIQGEFERLKVDGLFSASVLQTNRLNNIELSGSKSKFNGDKFSQKLFAQNPSDYLENKFKRAENKLKRIIHIFQNLEVNGTLFSNKINNISWVKFNTTVKKNEKTVTLTGAKKFKKLTAKNTNLSGTLNGRFPGNLLTNFSNQIIIFPQVFDSVKFKNVTLDGAWDGVFLDPLIKSLLKFSLNNGQASHLTSEDECFIDVLNVVDFVNDISFKNPNSQRKFFHNKIDLKSIKADNIIMKGSLVTNNNINNRNLTNFVLLRVSLKSPETIEHNLIHHTITFSGDLNLETLNLNDISSIINSGGDTNLIEKFLNGEISKIKKLLVKGNITTSQGINGFILSKISEKGFCITKPNSMKGNITFENTMNFDNINITNSINGFSLKNLEKDIAFKHAQIFLSGSKNFSVIRVIKNMKTRTLNGHLVQELVTLKGDQTMKGPVQINGNVILKGNITTYAAINNISVPDLLRIISTKFNAFIYSGDLSLRKDEVTVRNLVVDGNVQNISLDALIEDAVLQKKSFNISGKKYFEGEVKFKENVIIEGFIHGVNFSKFFSDVIFINKPERLEGTIIINDSVLKVLKTTRHFNSTLINNFDTNDWLEDTIPLSSYEVISGKKIFESAKALQDVSVDFINGHLPSAMISLKKKQYIPALSLFPRIHTSSDLTVAGYVNGKNLIKEFQDTVLVFGTQTISGKTSFDNEFIVNGTLFIDTIKGKAVNNLTTLDTEQIIQTPLEFKGLVMAQKDVGNLKIINNIRLETWSRNSVLLNQNQVLNGLWTVKGKVKTKNVFGKGLMHAVSLSDVSEELQKSRLMALGTKNATEVELSDQCQKVDEFSQKFLNLPYLFDQFEIADEIETYSVIDSVITFKINDENYLIITFINECLSALYKWNKDSGAFDYSRKINIGSVSKWSVIYYNKATYLITSSLKSNISCEENLLQGNVWVFKGDTVKYTHLLSTNAFADITYEKDTSGQFFTISENGVLEKWILGENGNISSKFLIRVGPGNYKFIDFRIMGGLAVSNGREIKQITLGDDKIIENNISFTNAHLVALPVEGKLLIAVVVKDKIVIYENILEDKIFSVIHTYRAGSVLWFNYGSEKQAFLIVASHHKLIEVYEYKSVSGLVKKMSLQIFSTRLQSETLPSKEKYQSDKFLIVIQKKKLLLIRSEMLGDFVKNNSIC